MIINIKRINESEFQVSTNDARGTYKYPWHQTLDSAYSYLCWKFFQDNYALTHNQNYTMFIQEGWKV